MTTTYRKVAAWSVDRFSTTSCEKRVCVCMFKYNCAGTAFLSHTLFFCLFLAAQQQQHRVRRHMRTNEWSSRASHGHTQSVVCRNNTLGVRVRFSGAPKTSSHQILNQFATGEHTIQTQLFCFPLFHSVIFMVRVRLTTNNNFFLFHGKIPNCVDASK